MKYPQFSESKTLHFLFDDTRFSWFWLLMRLYLGYEWIMAGWEKVMSADWVGDRAGNAIHGYFLGALQKASGAHPDVSGWYAYFLQHAALPSSTFLSYLVSVGELAVGVALILGIFTGLAAFFGAFMNVNYLFAGTVSINPQMLVLQLFLLLAWRTAGWFGLDRFVLVADRLPKKATSKTASKPRNR